MSIDIRTYDGALQYLINKQSLGIKLGLKRMLDALEVMGNPQNGYKTVHVAGTNGKGTVAATIAKALQESGYKVGLFTSPWVTDYREQIQINGAPITEEQLIGGVTVLDLLKAECTEFEALALIAYEIFMAEKVDYAVIECGMGGRGDATNVEKNNLSVITSISLDHTDFLGDTIDEIAEEKSGILRKNCTCVLYNDNLKSHFEKKCKRLITGNIKSNLDLVNAALKELNVPEASELIKLPARQERINGVLLDGGHNVAAAEMLAPLLYGEVAVIGMMRDKDVEGYLSLIAPKCKIIIATSPDNPRSMSAFELASRAKKYCKDVEIIESPALAVKEKGVTLVCGSFYLAREVRNLL